MNFNGVTKVFSRFLKVNTSLAVTLTLVATTAVVFQPGFEQPAQAVSRITKQAGFNARSWSVTSPDSQGIRYVGGDFTSYQAWNTGGGAAVDAVTGEVDSSFPEVSGWPYQKAGVSDGAGGFYIAGAMDNVGGTSVSKVAHLNADGSLDTTWLPNVTGGQGALTIAKFGDAILIGGSFTSVNGQARNRVAAIKTDGTLLPWNPNSNSNVHTIAVSGNTAYIGGQFSTLSGQARALVGSVRLDARTSPAAGTCLDNWDAADCITTWDPSAAGWGVKSLVVGSTYTYIIGAISQVGGQNRTGAAKVLTATGAVQPWDAGLDSEAGGGAMMNGKIYIGGNFGSAGGQTRRLVAAWDVTTDALESWNPDVSGNQVTSVSAVAGKIYFSGMFSFVGTTGRNHAAAVDEAGSLLAWDPNICNQGNGSNSTAHGVVATASKVYLLGDFTCVGGQKRMHAAAVSDSGLLTSWAPLVNGPVYTFSRTGSTIYIGGNFSSINGVSRSGAGAVDTTGAVTGWNPSPDGRAVSIISTASKVYMAGWFNTVGGATMRNLAALDPTTGSLDVAFDAQLDGAVRNMTLDGNNLFIGGDFANVGGEAHSYVASINATTASVNSAFTASTGTGTKTYPFLEAIAVVGNKVYIGGYFGEVNGQTRTHLAALNKVTGATDTTFNASASADIYAITPSADGKLVYVGGAASTITDGTDSATGVAAIDVQTGLLTSWRGDTDEVRGISTSEAVVYLAGSFGSVGGQGRENTAAVSTTGNVLEPWPMNPTEAVTLEVTIPNTAPGIVTSAPGGINCGASCAYSYSVGSSVTLTAVPSTGTVFDSWTGGCSGSSVTCTVTLAQSENTVATFRAASAPSSPNNNSAPVVTTTGQPTSSPMPTASGDPTPMPTASAEPTPVPTAATSVKTLIKFAPGKAVLDAMSKRALKSVAKAAQSAALAKITIAGSAQKTSYSLLDKVLAIARAKAVMAYLKSNGVKATVKLAPAKVATDTTALGRSAIVTLTRLKP